MDLPDITLIIQWKATCDLCTLWQRFGRAVRDMRLEGKALFLVEPKYFDTTKKTRADAAKERKRKAAQREAGNPHPAKRARTTKGSKPTKQAPEGPVVQPILQEGQAEGSMADVEEESECTSAETNQAMSDTQTRLPEGSTAIPDDTSRAAFEALRRVAYAEVPKTERKRTKWKVDEIEPALDDMINAASRQDIRCFRLPVIVNFAQRKSGRLPKLFSICCSLIYVR